MEGDNEATSRPMPGFHPLSRTSSTIQREAPPPEVQTRIDLDNLPISQLIRKNFGIKHKKVVEDKEEVDQDVEDVVEGDLNFENVTNNDYVNVFTAFDEDELRAEGFDMTPTGQKAEFNEPPPKRFGTKQKKTTTKWRPEDTELFYKILSMCGTDFSLISKFFPTRTRKMIVTKFHCEEKKFPQKVQDALDHPIPLDISLFAQTVDVDEATIVEDYQKNKDKLKQRPRIPPQPRRVAEKRPVPEDEWTDVSDEDDTPVRSTLPPLPNYNDDDDDKIQGDDNFDI